jgi:alpha-beta hydrolase superfamily lysophospholipase
MIALSMRHPSLIDGVVGLVPAIASPLKVSKLKVLEMLFASALKPRKLYPVPIRIEMFTGQEEALAFIRDDRLRLTHASARFFWSLLCMRRWVTAHPDKMTKPLLTLLAEKDEVIDNRGVREWLKRIPSTLSKTVEYPGAMHSILFEPCRDRVLKDIEEFMGRVESPCAV